MAKLSAAQQAERVLRLLMGLGDSRIAGAVRAYGFADVDLDEGWRLLRASSVVRVAPPPPPAVAPRIVAAIDAWDSRWYPIVDASLRKRFPRVHEQVFRNLGQVRGGEVLLTVATFIGRIRALDRAKDAESRAARALLVTRGLTAAVLDEAWDRLEEVKKLPALPPALEEGDADSEAAAAAAWDWYLEWSQIARAAVTDGRLRAKLGFGTPGRKRKRPDERGRVVASGAVGEAGG